MEAIRTVHSPNPIPTPSLDVGIVVDVLEAEEVTFILVTNKKGKRKTKVFSLSFTDFRTKISLISKASSVFKTVTTSIASKPAITYLALAIVATTISKPTQLQNTSSLVTLASKPKHKAKLFAYAAKANNFT